METKVITKTSKQFGNVRVINDNGVLLYCGSDVAKALGYSNARKAVQTHCKGVTKRDTPTNSGIQTMLFITEPDVYRLICHSKMPKALEFEKWVFEDVVPKAVRQQASAPEQLTLETSEYHYFGKTFEGEPVLTPADVEYFTGISKETVKWFLKKNTERHIDYTVLDKVWLIKYKAENPSVSRISSSVFVVHKNGFVKLMKYYNCKAKAPECFIEKKKAETVVSVPKPQSPTVGESIVALNVLQCAKTIQEQFKNKDSSRADYYNTEIAAIDRAIKTVGMLVVAS